MPIVSKYPLDKTGEAKTHRIVDEVHVLTKDKKVIVPKEAAFYTRNCVVKQKDKVMVHGVDYEFDNFYEDATRETGQEVMVSIRIISNIIDEIKISYQVVGGPFNQLEKNVIDLIEALMFDTRKVRYDDIINLPKAFPPQRHLHHVGDITGWLLLVTRMIEVRDAILALRMYKDTEIYRQLQDMYVRIGEIDDVRTGLIPQMEAKLEMFESIVGTEPLVRLVDFNSFKSTMETVDAGLKTQITNINNSIALVKTNSDKKDNELQSALNTLTTLVNTVNKRANDRALMPDAEYIGEEVGSSWINILTRGYQQGYTIQYSDPPFKVDHENKITNLEQLNLLLEQNFATISGHVISAEQSITDIISRLNNMDLSLGTIGTSLEDLVTLREYINDSVRELRNTVSNAVNALTADMNELSTSLKVDQMQALAQVRDETDAKIEAQQAKINVLERNLTALRGELIAEIKKQQDTLLKDLELYVRSRQSDLVTNGAGLYQSTRNFTHVGVSFNADTKNAVSAYGWFKHIYNRTIRQPEVSPDEFISIQKNFSYRLSVDVQLISEKANFRLGYKCYTKEHVLITTDINTNGIQWLTERVQGPLEWDTYEGVIQGGWKPTDDGILSTIDTATFYRGTAAIKPVLQLSYQDEEINEADVIESGFVNLKVVPITEIVEAKRMPGFESTVRTIVNRMVDESRGELNPTSRWNLADLRVQPGAESFSGWSIDGNDNLIIRGIVYMDMVNEGERGIFAPTETLNVNANQEWRIPAAYDKRIAKVTIRAASKINDDKTVTHSAVREMFIMVTGDRTVNITAGEIASFGTYLTVANGMDYDDAMTPRVTSIAGSKIYPALVTIQV